MGSPPTPPPAFPLLVTIGPPGAGKSTWLAGRFPPEQLFSLDATRRWLAGDVATMDATDAAVEVLDTAVRYRMTTARTTAVDGTYARWEHREALRAVALVCARPAVAVMMHTRLRVCIDRQATRSAVPGYAAASDQPVPADVIGRMHRAIERDPPTRDDWDLVVHVHPEDPAVAYAYPGAARSVSWAIDLLEAEPWGRPVTLLTGRGARLPWYTPVNTHG